MKEIKIENNAQQFLNRAEEVIGNFEHDKFGIEIHNNFHDLQIESPIEQIFYIAFKVIRQINYEPELDIFGPNDEYVLGVGIKAQEKIGNYRVDFMASYDFYDKIKRRAIVECDGHEFHDRTEKERRYEKQRDRFLQSKGYRIFHFTGSEINQSPFRCAAEVFSYLTDRDLEDCLDINYLPEGEI